MNELSSLGLILLVALLAGHVAQFLRVPEVTGYILAGIALGPSVLGWISHKNLLALAVVSEVALGLILLSVGSVFQFARLRRFGRRIVYLTLTESMLAGLLVSAAMFAMDQPWQVALLLGAIAMETAPASTLMVLRECHSRGPLTETIMGIIAINNLLCLSTYTLVTSTINLVSGPAGGDSFIGALYGAVYSLLWQIIGSAALGYLVGLMVSGWATKVTEHGEMLTLLAGSVLLCVGAARILDLSPLVASLAVGGTMANLSSPRRRLFDALSLTDPPFYVIFFVIAGADLDVSLVSGIGAVGACYLLARLTGKFVGARLAAGKLNLDTVVQRFLGYALMAHAGLAVGLTLNVSYRFPAWSTVVSAVVLSSVVICEVIGPIAAKFAIVRSGESRASTPEPGVLWD